ncbi:unnamed protein product [Angiostrongylus costaricensis]|uniref:Mitochondrial fission 1 protein n=1 Tax=Angiostrongylus costaricensis TaxID=334426 RepID=A0A158PES1_ANGCS|nr:unnamed protein product [Angiostrongylus costaricensis]
MLMDVDNILDERVDPYDLEKVRDTYETQLQRGSPSAVATFNYAVALVRSTKQDNYDRALAYVDILLAAESHNRQATHLRTMIEKRMKRDGLFGLAVIGGGALLLTGVVAALFAAKK